MRWRVIALVSLGVNIALGVAWLFLDSHEAARIAAAAAGSSQPPTIQTTTNFVARRTAFLLAAN